MLSTIAAVGAREIDLAVAIADHVATSISRAEAAESLQRTVRFNEMFTGILAHDLRNPLSSIIMAARLVNTWNEGEKLLKPLSRILKSAERMTRMIDQLLDFTRIRLQGRIPVFPSSSDLSAVLRQVIDELDGVNRDWQFRLRTTGDTIGHWDADRLSQVFSNLVANAVQHGSAEWGVEMTVDGRESATVRVTVKNMAVIPAELLPKLFEPLVAVRSLENASGLGLGLYITREIIGAHGGTIEVHSDDTSGTIFMVSLPRHRSRIGSE